MMNETRNSSSSLSKLIASSEGKSSVSENKIGEWKTLKRGKITGRRTIEIMRRDLIFSSFICQLKRDEQSQGIERY